MADYGLKISKAGFDVLTANTKDLVFHSQNACLKVVQSGSVTFGVDSGNTYQGTIALNNSLPLFFTLFGYNPNSSAYKPFANQVLADNWGDFLHFYYEFNSSNLYPTIENLTGGSINSHYIYLIGYT